MCMSLQWMHTGTPTLTSCAQTELVNYWANLSAEHALSSQRPSSLWGFTLHSQISQTQLKGFLQEGQSILSHTWHSFSTDLLFREVAIVAWWLPHSMSKSHFDSSCRKLNLLHQLVWVFISLPPLIRPSSHFNMIILFLRSHLVWIVCVLVWFFCLPFISLGMTLKSPPVRCLA